MAVMSKADAKKFNEMTDKFIDVLNYLQGKKIINAADHRAIMLKGFSKLVDILQEKKVINAKAAKDAMKGGFASLLTSLS